MVRIGKYKTVHMKKPLHDRLAALARKPKKIPITRVIEELVEKEEIDRKKRRGTLRS